MINYFEVVIYNNIFYFNNLKDTKSVHLKERIWTLMLLLSSPLSSLFKVVPLTDSSWTLLRGHSIWLFSLFAEDTSAISEDIIKRYVSLSYILSIIWKYLIQYRIEIVASNEKRRGGSSRFFNSKIT